MLMATLHGDLSGLARVLDMAVRKRSQFNALVEEARKYGLNTMLDDMEVATVLDPDKKTNVMLSLHIPCPQLVPYSVRLHNQKFRFLGSAAKR